MNPRNCSHGFTLTEVLVALVLFSISMLGITAHIANTMQASASAQIQANASEILLQLSEPLNRAAAHTDKTVLQQLLNRLSLQSHNNMNSDIADRFSYQLLSATDASQQGLLETQPDNWQAPYTVRVSINYQHSEQQTYRIPQTIVLAP